LSPESRLGHIIFLLQVYPTLSPNLNCLAYRGQYTDTTFFYWIEQDQKEKEDSFRGSGKPRASNEELVQLRKELENVRLERDILKKAVAIFSRQK
jgi:transposase